jgi:hypothetical protein
MQLYKEADLALVKENLPKIIEKIDEHKLNTLEPTKEQAMNAINVALEYIKENKRKIYGGYAQNKIISDKNPKDAFYNDNDIPDVDYYSPEPLVDVIKICNILHEKGFKSVTAQEALHKETYKVFVDYNVNVCDISYVPKNVYYKIPTVEIKGIQYVHPSFIMIDLYRMLTEPYFSSFRWEKVFPRIYLLQKHYPFNKPTKELPDVYGIDQKSEKVIHKYLSGVFDFLSDRKSVIVYGQYAYNHFYDVSKPNNKKIKQIDVTFYEFMSSEYIEDANLLLEKLQNLIPENKNKIKVIEYYPFWQLTGYNCWLFYENIPLVHITYYNKRCTSFKEVDAVIFYNGEKEVPDKKAKIQIGTFDFVFLMNMVNGLYAKVNNEGEKYNYHNIMTSHLIEIRNHYLDKNKKTLMDNTLFQEFVPDCIGKVMYQERELRIEREKKYKSGKLVVFRYNPSEDKKDTVSTYRFANTSGNKISNVKNLKLTHKNGELTEDVDEEPTTES